MRLSRLPAGRQGKSFLFCRPAANRKSRPPLYRNLMTERKNNTFFTKDIYETEIELDLNANVLERIYKSKISPASFLSIEFFFVSDKEEKLKRLGIYLLSAYPTYSSFKVQPYETNYELSGLTHPIQMKLSVIDEWNKKMWDIGYEFDCKLDGWQVEH